MSAVVVFSFFMQAPRLRSMFRNVRTEPRRFQFRSRHMPDLDPKWAERRERIEAQVAGEEAPDAVPARPIRFRSNRTTAELKNSTSEWKERRLVQIIGARYAMLRAVVIAAGLVWLAWRGLVWVETSDFSEVLKWMENA
ncbi:MAG: hypothetical protein CL828_06335 [Crocinitomicaceae bacterium]|nr:hypothetical protein [Crocinitomicaceae bacterium]